MNIAIVVVIVVLHLRVAMLFLHQCSSLVLPIIVIGVLHLRVTMLFLSQCSSLILSVIVIVVHHRALILSLNFRPQMVLYIHQLCKQETPLHQLVMIHLLCIFLLIIQAYLRHRIFHHRTSLQV
jgi:hypothetical protein